MAHTLLAFVRSFGGGWTDDLSGKSGGGHSRLSVTTASHKTEVFFPFLQDSAETRIFLGYFGRAV